MTRHPYIAIEGVIGVGKTTLARLLHPTLGGELVLEVFEENPFLSDFYGDRARYAFQTQIFFLLSRYRQQTATVPSALLRGPVIADYTFAKDRLFALLNLTGDELDVYERVYSALGEKVREPDLLVYLRASLDVLMGRIALRDRPYERNMDRSYIDQLRAAYDDFIAQYSGPLLVIETDDLNFVQNPDDLAKVTEQVKSSLRYGTYQARLPGVEGVESREPTEVLQELAQGSRRLLSLQHFHVALDAEKGFNPDLYFNFIALNEEIGELARRLKVMWLQQCRLEQSGQAPQAAREQALAEHRHEIEEELADCLAYLLKLSNYAGIDLEQAYLQKMNINTQRRWQDGRIVEEAR